jgi:hypothetical protein
MEDVTIIIPLSERGNPARFLFKEGSYAITTLGATLNVLRAGRTDQTVSVDYTITGMVAAPQSGTLTFFPGTTQLAVQMAASASGTGVLKLSNPQYVSGTDTTPPELGARTVVAISANIPGQTGRNVQHTVDFESGQMRDDRFFPDSDSAGNKCFNAVGDLHNITGFTKASPARITVATDGGWLTDADGEGSPDGVIIRNMSGTWGAALNDRLIRTKNFAGSGGLEFDAWFDHVIPGYMGDGQGLESTSDDGDMGRNPLDTTGLSGSWPGDGQIEGVFRRIEQLDEVSTTSNTDQKIMISGSGTIGADTNVPSRSGSFFFRNRTWYIKPYDINGRVSTGNLKGGNSGHNKPRGEIQWPTPSTGIIYPHSDEEFWYGLSIYWPTDYVHHLDVGGTQSGNLITSIGTNTKENGIGSFEVFRPGKYGTSGGIAVGEIGESDIGIWGVEIKMNDAGLEGVKSPLTVETHSLGPIDDDLGLWTDFVFRIRWNPFSVQTNPALDLGFGKNQVYEANTGIYQVWKSTGPYIDGNRNRLMQLVLDKQNEPVGTVPDVDDELDFSIRQYMYGWHRNPPEPVWGVSKFYQDQGLDEIRYGSTVRDGTGYSDVHPGAQLEPALPFTRSVWFRGDFESGVLQANGGAIDGFYAQTLPTNQVSDETVTSGGGGFGPTADTDLQVVQTWTIPANGNGGGTEVVTPRAGNYFVKNLLDRNKNYSNIADGKTRSSMSWAQTHGNFDIAFGQEVWFGFSYFIASNWEVENGQWDSSGIMLVEYGTQASRDLFTLELETWPDRFGTETQWFLKLERSLTSQENIKGVTDSDHYFGDVELDKGMWTDFVIRVKTGDTDGVLQVWKSTGPILDASGNRQMTKVMDLTATNIGLQDDGQLLRLRPCKGYAYDWYWVGHPQDYFATQVQGPIALPFDQFFLARTIEEAASFQDVHATTLPEPDATFTSDAVCWIDTGAECGAVPTSYANYQMLRTMALHINSAETNSFTVDRTTEVIYAHPTFNAGTDYQPSFLSTWDFTGHVGSMTIPGQDGRTQTCPVYYYKQTIPANSPFTWEWRSTNIEEALSYFVGWFLFPAEAVVSDTYPEPYAVVSDISAAYTPLARDWLYDPTPSSRPATTRTAANWADILVEAQASTNGDVIQIPAGDYNDEAELIFDGLQFSPDNPLWIVPPETTLDGTAIPSVTLRGGSKFTFTNCQGIRVWGFVDKEGTGNLSGTRISIGSDCSYVSIENVDFGNAGTDDDAGVWTSVQLRGRMNRVANCRQDGRTSSGNTINFIPDDNDNLLSQHNIIRYCDFDNYNIGETAGSEQNNAYIRLGGNNNHAAEAYTLVQYNRLRNWTQSSSVSGFDAEAMVNKSCGHMVVNNYAESYIGAGSCSTFMTRVSAWSLVMGNSEDCGFNTQNMQGAVAQGVDPAEGSRYTNTRLIYAGNAVKNFTGVNGYLQVNEQDGNSTSRWVANNCLMTQVYAKDVQDQFVRFNDNLSVNKVSPTNIHLNKLFVENNQNLAIQEYDTTGLVTFTNSKVSNSGGFTVTGTPSGITTADPGLYDRGDGVHITADALVSAGITECLPVAIQGPTIPNLGPTYSNAEFLTEGAPSTNLYMDPTGGSDSNNGLYATDQGGGNGPKKTFAGINALNLSSVTGIWLLAGTTTTCKTEGSFYDQTDFIGTANKYSVLGSYFIQNGTHPVRGLGGNARPIVQGTVARPHDYDGTNQLGNSGVYPTATATAASRAGLIGVDAQAAPYAGYIQVENIHVRHSGGRGIVYRDVDNVSVINCYAELCLSSGIRSQSGSNILFDGNYVTGCCGTQQWYGHNSRPHALSVRGTASNVIIRNNVIWQNWGESTGAGHDICTDFLIEDNVIFDNKHVHIYVTACQDSVVRRNLCFQSGKAANNYSTFGVGGPNGLSYQGAEEGENGGVEDKTANCAFYSNIVIGANRANIFQDQDANPTKGSGISGDMKDFWIFRNTFIDAGSQEYGETGPGRTTSTGTIRVWDNMHLTFEDGAHDVDPDVPRGIRSLENNSWNGTGVPGHFSNNVTGDVWTGDESGWQTHALATWSADNHIEIENVEAYITAVKAKLGGPTGAAM